MLTNVEIIQKLNLDLTIFIVTGLLSKEKMLATQADYYAEKTTRSILCDLTKATWCNMPDDHILGAVNKGQRYAKTRKGCKTAVVVASDHDFEITQQFAKSASGIAYGPKIMVFRNIPSASSWLNIPEF